MSLKSFTAAAVLACTVGAVGVGTARGADAAPPAAAAADKGPGPTTEKLPSPVIVVVNVQKVLQECQACKGIDTVIEGQFGKDQKVIAALEDKVRAADQELRKQQTILSPEALANKRKEFEAKIAEGQKTAQSLHRALEEANNQAKGVVQKTMLEIIADLVRERGANVVLGSQQFILVDTKLDITEVVMERLNAKLPNVAVTVPKQ